MEKCTGQDTIFFFAKEGCYFRNKDGRTRATLCAMDIELAHR
jgi:hypothetical protein